MFTPEGATLEQPPAAATSARLRAAGPARVRADGWAETAYAVEAVGQLGGPVPAGTVVLSTPADGAAAPDLAALEPGDPVTVTWSFAAWPGILETSGGNQPRGPLGHQPGRRRVDHHGDRRHDRQPGLRPQERRVPTALLVLREPAPPVPPPPAALTPEAEADLDAAADPGSTAGLLQWLAADDAPD